MLNSPFALLYHSDQHVCWVFGIISQTLTRDSSPEMKNSANGKLCKVSSTTKYFTEQQQCCSNHFTIRTGFKQLGTIRQLFIPFSSVSELNMLAHTPTLSRKVNCMFIYLRLLFCSQLLHLLHLSSEIPNIQWVNAWFIFIYLFIGWSLGLMVSIKLWQKEGKSRNNKWTFPWKVFRSCSDQGQWGPFFFFFFWSWGIFNAHLLC